MRGLTRRSLMGISALTVAMVFPVGVSSGLAARAHGNTSSGTSVTVQSGSGATTTPNACSGALNRCATMMLKLINQDRVVHGLPRVALKPVQSAGTASCVGSYGHSQAMAKSGAIWHTNAQFPRASFPHSICVPFMHAGENVGQSAMGNVNGDLQALDTLMMSEPHSASVCATTVNHACNILNPAFRHVGIGIYYADGATWLTEDFTN